MNKKTNFLKSLFNFVDRHLIMPITRVVFKITKRLSTPSKRLESWISKPATLLFLSLFLSVVTFIVVDQKIITFSSQSAQVFKDQKVKII